MCRIAFLLMLLLVAPASAQIVQFSGASVIPQGWSQLRIDGGGFVTGIDIQCNQGVGSCSAGSGTVTMVNRTDTAGAWLWNGNLWTQILTKQSFPAGEFRYAGFLGVCEIRIAPSNTNHLYMYFNVNQGNGYVYESLNKGTTWTRTGFSAVNCDAAASPEPKQYGPKIAVDPYNEAVTYVGTQTSGVFYTLNGGNGTWRAVNIDTGSPTWTNIDAATATPGFPLGNWDWIKFVQGDMNIPGRVYVGFAGSGWAFGQFNYLLGRDLDPASNDNSPAWLAQTA